jgi:hypothetical protein
VHKAGVLGWALVSAGLMAVGAFGPWVNALGVLSLTGWDIQNKQAGVLLIIAIGGGAAVFTRRSGAWALIAGVAGLALTFWEHHRMTSLIAGTQSQYRELASAFVHIGWGLNLALVASISLALSGLASFFFEASPTGETPAAASTPTLPAGWYRDPNDEALLRYWNGFGWTTQTAKPAS